MNDLSSLGTIVAAILAIMTTVVAGRVLRGHSTLDHPMIPVCVGLLVFISLRHLPAGMTTTILIGYAALAISVLFLLLLSMFVGQRRTPGWRHRADGQDSGLSRSESSDEASSESPRRGRPLRRIKRGADD